MQTRHYFALQSDLCQCPIREPGRSPAFPLAAEVGRGCPRPSRLVGVGRGSPDPALCWTMGASAGSRMETFGRLACRGRETSTQPHRPVSRSGDLDTTASASVEVGRPRHNRVGQVSRSGDLATTCRLLVDIRDLSIRARGLLFRREDIRGQLLGRGCRLDQGVPGEGWEEEDGAGGRGSGSGEGLAFA
jgi:hypothetical protein